MSNEMPETTAQEPEDSTIQEKTSPEGVLGTHPDDTTINTDLKTRYAGRYEESIDQTNKDSQS